MSGETRFAFYSSVTGSTLPASSIGSGSIETYHLSASAVTPAKADLTADWNFTSGSVRVATPVSNSHATPKSYVLSVISESIGVGGTINAAKGAVRTVLVGDDTTTGFFQYSSGALTFQGNANLNDFGIGGITDFTSGDRVLFSIPASAACFAASGSWSGIYTITNVGANDPSGSAPVLTRATDFDATSEITPGSFVFANAGNPTTDAPEIWYLVTSGSVTLDSTPLLFASASFSVTGSGGGTTYTGSNTIQIDGSAISVKTGSIGPSHLSGTIVEASGGLQVHPIMGLSVLTSGAIGVESGSVYLKPNSIGNGYIKTDFVYGGGSDALSVDPGGLRLNLNAITPSYLSSSVAGNGLTLSAELQVLADPVAQNPLVVSAAGVSVRAASSTQSGYMSTASYDQLASVVSYSSPPVTAGPIGTAVTTSNTQTAAFNIGVVPANTIWTIKFTTFSIDTAEAANLVNNVGAFSIYRSGSNNATQVGNTEIEHSFVSGAFSFVTMSLNLAQGQPGNADFVLQGINTYNIKHWAKFQITEFVYA